MKRDQKKEVTALLSDGGKYSVVDIMQRLYISDPRSVIRDIRNDGIEVCDEWYKTPNTDSRYKRYWIDKGPKLPWEDGTSKH